MPSRNVRSLLKVRIQSTSDAKIWKTCEGKIFSCQSYDLYLLPQLQNAYFRKIPSSDGYTPNFCFCIQLRCSEKEGNALNSIVRTMKAVVVMMKMATMTVVTRAEAGLSSLPPEGKECSAIQLVIV